MEERRKRPRLDDDRRVSCALIPEHPDPGGGLVTLSGEVRNISRDGIEFQTFTQIPARSFVRIDLPLILGARRRTVSLSGMVRWCRIQPGEDRFTVGVEFLDLRDADRNLWASYVESLAG